MPLLDRMDYTTAKERVFLRPDHCRVQPGDLDEWADAGYNGAGYGPDFIKHTADGRLFILHRRKNVWILPQYFTGHRLPGAMP